MSALINRQHEDLRPAEHHFALTAALISLLFAAGPASAVLMLIAQA
jgi:hypothetical protein